MGCDIHLHIEVKIDKQWRHLGCPQVKRNYALFAKMAGVRNSDSIEPIALPKGLPSDITFLTNYDHERMKTDAHSQSWLNADEIAKLDNWLSRETMWDKFISLEYSLINLYLFGNGFGDFKEFPDDFPKSLEDVRFIFWFDC